MTHNLSKQYKIGGPRNEYYLTRNLYSIHRCITRCSLCIFHEKGNEYPAPEITVWICRRCYDSRSHMEFTPSIPGTVITHGKRLEHLFPVGFCTNPAAGYKNLPDQRILPKAFQRQYRHGQLMQRK